MSASKAAKTMRKSTTKAAKPRGAGRLGELPEWNLGDLYTGIESPELKWDLENAENQCA